MQKYLLFILLFLIGTPLFAQREKIHVVKNVYGEFSVVLSYSDITGRDAVQLARDDAKRKAIEKVCGTRINIWNQMETSSAGDFFNSLSVNQSEGEVVEFEIIEEGHRQSQVRANETIFFCNANVKVKQGSEPDPSFIVNVSGIKSVYYTKDHLLFDILPSQDCYMKVFLFEDVNTGYMLYPNVYDSSVLLPANKKFNINDSPYNFELQKQPDTSVEINRLVFVFTKTERSFNSQNLSRADIEKWIAMIPNNEKFLHFSIIEIRDN